MIARWIVLLGCACGRIAFDPRDTGTGSGAPGDGPPLRDGTLDDGGNEVVSFGENGTATYSNVTTDTFLDQQHVGFNNGGANLVASQAVPSPVTGLLRFDVSAIPPTRSITAAKLVLHVILESTSSVDVYAVDEAWSEGTAIMSPGVASWNERSAGTAWTTAGAGSPGSRGSQSLATFLPAMPNTTMEVELDPAGTTAVQRWVTDPSTNHGVAFVSSAAEWYFASREHPTATVRPLLVLTVAP